MTSVARVFGFLVTFFASTHASLGEEYEDLVRNTADFYNSKKDPKFYHAAHSKYARKKVFVLPGQVRVEVEDVELYTSALATCSAIAISYKGRILLGHVNNEQSQPALIENKIKKFFEGNVPKDVKVMVLGGMMNNTWSKHRIRTALKNLGLEDNIVYLGAVRHFGQDFGVTQQGTFLTTPPRMNRKSNALSIK